MAIPKTLIACVFAIAIASLSAAEEAPDDSWTRDPVSQLVFFSVLEGLYVDGVSNEDVDRILAVDALLKQPNLREHFVINACASCSCPICHPAAEAFLAYRRRPALLPHLGASPNKSNTFGNGLEKELSKQLNSAQKKERLAGIQTLIQRWIKRRLDSMHLSAEEQKDWMKKIDAHRQKGNMVLLKATGLHPGYKDWEACPSCEGAAQAAGAESSLKREK